MERSRDEMMNGFPRNFIGPGDGRVRGVGSVIKSSETHGNVGFRVCGCLEGIDLILSK